MEAYPEAPPAGELSTSLFLGEIAAPGLVPGPAPPEGCTYCQRITYGRLPLRASSAGVRFA